jgi:hypothetical protein
VYSIHSASTQPQVPEKLPEARVKVIPDPKGHARHLDAEPVHLAQPVVAVSQEIQSSLNKAGYVPGSHSSY